MDRPATPMTFEEWLRYGINNEYCTPPRCGAHDGTPFDEIEWERFENGEDPCVTIIRILDND